MTLHTDGTITAAHLWLSPHGLLLVTPWGAVWFDASGFHLIPAASH